MDNSVADDQDASESKSNDTSRLIECVAVGDANEAVIEDGGQENNSTKNAPQEGKKTDFPSAIPAHLRFPNQDYESYENGYDSDGELVYFDEYAEMGENPDNFIEDALVEGAAEAPEPAPAAPATITTPSDHPPAVALKREHIMSMLAKELKDELVKRGKSKSAKNKAILQQRLINSMNAPVSKNSVAREAAMRGVDVTAKWFLLEPNPTPIPEPENPDSNLPPPTERDGAVTPKFSYPNEFKRDPFEGTTEKMPYIYETKEGKKKSAGRKKAGRKQVSPTHKTRRSKVEPRVLGGPNDDFLNKYKLDENSHPVHWLNAILPMFPYDNLEDVKDIDVTNDGKTKFSISMWTGYTNKKASFENAGEPGHIYAGKWKDFTTKEIATIIGTYILDSVNPSPRLSQKMQPQSRDKTQGNDFISRNVGSNPELCHKLFRHFFGCQDPTTIPPKKEDCPNFKVDSFF